MEISGEQWTKTRVTKLRKFLITLVADVAELADALDSKSSIREDVWVRPPPSAPSKSTTYVDLLDMLLQCCYTVAHEIESFS